MSVQLPLEWLQGVPVLLCLVGSQSQIKANPLELRIPVGGKAKLFCRSAKVLSLSPQQSNIIVSSRNHFLIEVSLTLQEASGLRVSGRRISHQTLRCD